jgi:pimeloyl-ACP methyl ester carboxylesterase
MARSTLIGVGVGVALVGVVACGGSPARRSRSTVGAPGRAGSPARGLEQSRVPIRVVTMRGSDGPGPSRYNRVRVVEVGRRQARHVLVLVPGTSAGAGYFVPVAEDIVAALHGWQVWAVDRRENLLEDHSVLDRARGGTVGGRALFDYYLGWIANPAIARHYRPPADADLGFARRWGMRVAVEDLARVIRAARAGGRRVVLGGHSLGGWIATAYAAWDFGGRAGARDLDGVVLIDGASGPPAISPTDARETLGQIRRGSPFLSVAGARLPWIAGVLSAVGSTLAVREPDAPSLLQAWSLLPAAVKPLVPATNLAQFGFSVDVDTSPKSLAGGQAHLGGLAASGNPRGFRDGGFASAQRAARALSGVTADVDGIAWFHPRRLTLDARQSRAASPTARRRSSGCARHAAPRSICRSTRSRRRS